MPTFDDIPDEILDYLLEEHIELDAEDLSTAALVSRRWREPAQRALFGHLVIHGSEKATKWLESP